MAESRSPEILRFASSIIARHGSRAFGFADQVATHFRRADSHLSCEDISQIPALRSIAEIATPFGSRGE
jgi:hypothetical protein